MAIWSENNLETHILRKVIIFQTVFGSLRFQLRSKSEHIKDYAEHQLNTNLELLETLSKGQKGDFYNLDRKRLLK